jgi:hypothetical protein
MSWGREHKQRQGSATYRDRAAAAATTPEKTKNGAAQLKSPNRTEREEHTRDYPRGTDPESNHEVNGIVTNHLNHRSQQFTPGNPAEQPDP